MERVVASYFCSVHFCMLIDFLSEYITIYPFVILLLTYYNMETLVIGEYGYGEGGMQDVPNLKVGVRPSQQLAKCSAA